jgi:carbamoyltransferase
MIILGISAYYHDSAAALLVDGELVAAAQEERFTRKKHDPSFPVNAIRFCLDFHGISGSQVDSVVFYDKPLLKFERLLETYYAFAPRGLASFISSIPAWIKEKLFLKDTLCKELKKIGWVKTKTTPLLFTSHHLSHAASAFYPSPFKDAAILTVDGVGEWATASICSGNKKEITLLREMNFPHSIGLLYSAFTYYLGFRVNSGEYKLMGLAPYGNASAAQTREFAELIKTRLCAIRDDGSVKLNMALFTYATGLRMVPEKKWEKLFGFPVRKESDPLEQHHCNLAFAIQEVTEEIIFKLADTAHKLNPNTSNLCLAGGVALNCVANGKLLNKGIFKNIYIQPAAGDAGGAVGAAYAAWHIFYNKERIPIEGDPMKGSYLGPEFNREDIVRLINKYKALATECSTSEQLNEQVTEYLSTGAVVGWFQGRMEFGPRALGNRSILGDPRKPEMQKKLNLKIKFREGFRPFAPAVNQEYCKDYFEGAYASPYMLLIDYVSKEHRKELPKDYYELSIMEMLYHQRSDIQSITHVDYSARVQTVHQSTNPKFHALIDAFKKKTGVGLLVNTSFNVRGEPIVCSPDDAYKCFMRTGMDFLVLGNYIFDKSRQPDWKEGGEWKKGLKAD